MIQTVEEFLENRNLPESLSGGTLKYTMIEFATIHVNEALKQASEQAKADYPYSGVDKDSILEAYSYTNIK